MLAAPVPVLTVIMTSQDQGTAGRDNPRACHAIERRPTQVIYRWNDVSRLIRLDFQTADSVRMPGWEQDSPPQVASRAARGVIVLHLLSGCVARSQIETSAVSWEQPVLHHVA